MALGNRRINEVNIIMEEEVRIDVRTQSLKRIAEAKRSSDLCFRINHTNPTTPECQELVQELFISHWVKILLFIRRFLRFWPINFLIKCSPQYYLKCMLIRI